MSSWIYDIGAFIGYFGLDALRAGTAPVTFELATPAGDAGERWSAASRGVHTIFGIFNPFSVWENYN